MACLKMWEYFVLFTSLLPFAVAQKDPHFVNGRTTIVHLFEWTFKDIAKECENFLGPIGYGGVQVSPVNENLIIRNRPWYERYQPLSYKIISRSGNETEFKNMVKRCNNVGVRVYVDTVINHMSGNSVPAIGTGGSVAQPTNFSYPAVPYEKNDFHYPCTINNYMDPVNVRNCELSGLHDLDMQRENVRNKIVGFMNSAVDAGIAGFRVDAAKHMWPEDLRVIYGRVKNLDKEVYGDAKRPLIYQEVIDLGTEAVTKWEYVSLGRVIDFQFGIVLGEMFAGRDKLARLGDWGTLNWNLPSTDSVLVMVDNHDNQRGHGAGGAGILTYKKPREYKMAIAFMLAHPYGLTRIMSSFDFNDPSIGPPMDANENIIAPEIDAGGQCKNGWVCEHRWPEIYNMVKFRNIVNGEPLRNWWSNGNNQIAFARGTKGFVAFNVEGNDLRKNLQTGLLAGVYCDVFSGSLVNGTCTGRSVKVGPDGNAFIEIPAQSEGVLAIHNQARLSA